MIEMPTDLYLLVFSKLVNAASNSGAHASVIRRSCNHFEAGFGVNHRTLDLFEDHLDLSAQSKDHSSHVVVRGILIG